jgi:hypothetical protein
MNDKDEISAYFKSSGGLIAVLGMAGIGERCRATETGMVNARDLTFANALNRPTPIRLLRWAIAAARAAKRNVAVGAGIGCEPPFDRAPEDGSAAPTSRSFN